MGLLTLADAAPFLACPRCRCRAVEDGQGFRCSSESCVFNASGSFPLIDGRPALVDFEHSVLPRDERLGSVPGGRNRWSVGRLPRRLRSWAKPRNRAAARNVKTMIGLLPGPAPLILIVGGGTMGNGIEEIYSDRRTRVAAFDIYGSPLVQFIADAHQIPVASQSVDAVLIQAVLQQVVDPGKVVSEIHRVLRKGALVYAETPFLQQVVAGPYDFVRYTSSGHRYLFRAFEEIAAGPVAGPGTQLLWSVDHVVRGLLRSEPAGKLTRLAFFWLRYLDDLIPTAFAMDNASAYYFLGRRSERELSPRDIVAYYRGAQRSAAGGE